MDKTFTLDLFILMALDFAGASLPKKHRDDSTRERAERKLLEAFEVAAKSQGSVNEKTEKG
jgi:hypothetical protein